MPERFYTNSWDEVLGFEGELSEHGTVTSTDGLIEELELNKAVWRSEGEALAVLLELAEREFKVNRLRLKKIKKLARKHFISKKGKKISWQPKSLIKTEIVDGETNGCEK